MKIKLLVTLDVNNAPKTDCAPGKAGRKCIVTEAINSFNLLVPRSYPTRIYGPDCKDLGNVEVRLISVKQIK
jgi:hypothetical protein